MLITIIIIIVEYNSHTKDKQPVRGFVKYTYKTLEMSLWNFGSSGKGIKCLLLLIPSLSTDYGVTITGLGLRPCQPVQSPWT